MENIWFRYYDRHLSPFYDVNFRSDHAVPHPELCKNFNNSSQYSIVIPGWREHCSTSYVRKAIKNLHKFRGGCVICMDYTNYSFTQNYKCLYNAFKEIRYSLYLFYLMLEKGGVQFKDLYVFGHSFGSQIALQASTMIGNKRIGAIDACDPAGIFFDGSGLMRKILLDINPRDVRSAAKTVDCWHTSGIYGTKYRLSCDRNWLLGICGLRQPASITTNITSHSFCPIYYNLSFKYTFPVVKQQNLLCSMTNPAKYWPDGFKLGYLETRKRLVHGQINV
uniref:CSON015091 protein n=1 Tax=Culicoides sonorensis TaxID=179676 RepID=A0A336MCU2_CULSO